MKRDGASVRSGCLTLAFLRDAEENTPARVGIVTSRRVGHAIVRNRTRRRLREIFRRHQQRLPSGLWLVVIGSARASAMTSAALEDDWLRLAERASILAP
ncbi:MAG: ribonuclease P protein component [Verrucomicrobiota bacterium]|nr:ribonuclease P protein component [Verrucomicrobiota bacterium]